MKNGEFTAEAQQAIRTARREAEAMGHSYVGSEHLLLGLLREKGSLAQRCLRAEGVEEARTRATIRSLVGEGFSGLAPVQGLTAAARAAIRRAAAAASPCPVGTEHLLQGLLAGRDTMATRVLLAMGTDTEKLERRLGVCPGGEVCRQEWEEPPRSKLLEQITVSLSAAAYRGELDPVIGREREIRRTIEILTRRTKNNPVLLGEPGVGKTAVVEGLAQKIVRGDVPEALRGRTILSLDLASLLAGTKYRGEFEEKVRSALQELKRMKSGILFIDELHTIVGAGSSEGAVDAANLLKPALGRREIQIIGATTLEEYRQYIEKDGALARRFQPVTVEEPSPETAAAILQGLRPRYEAHHGLTISDDAIRAAVSLSVRCIQGRFLPDKAIDLMDEACSRVRLQPCREEDALLAERLEEVRRDRALAQRREDREREAQLRDVEADFREQLQERRVTGEDVAAAASEWTGIPLGRLTGDQGERLLGLEARLGERIVGQREAVSAAARAICRSRAGLASPERPQASFLLVGPTGVGKTELCRALAEEVFGGREALLRLDMSEYSEAHSVSRLVGAPPGYVGHEEGGRLTEAVRRRPFSLVLLDELEKAHPQVWNLLLQILEEGCLTDSLGRRVDFRHTVVAMTSNAGADRLSGRFPPGFADREEETLAGDRAREAARCTFSPELLSRIDEVLSFRRLTREDLAAIADRLLGETAARLADRGICLQWDRDAGTYLADRTGGAGARPLRGLIRRQVEDPLAEGILRGTIGRGDVLRLEVREKQLAISPETVYTTQ